MREREKFCVFISGWNFFATVFWRVNGGRLRMEIGDR